MMSIRPPLFSVTAWSTGTLAAILLSSVALAATPAKTNSEIEARYQSDVALCNSGQSNQDKADCMREAGAARDEARRNRLNNSNQAYDKNEVARCQALPTAERDECMLQMSGSNTTTQGSVGAGGVLRETTITTPGK
ncbi:hypothetical protein [Pollutimonas bauzanensis]|uniref:hypothetical protein n=1 Tax=Pollutimonas bauzanensis TaxID=658167 RepID=UPI0033411555